MLKMSQSNSPDDSDDSLPGLSEIFKAPSTTISSGDIVWAKFKGLYWPALVRAMYPKEKKISIWYADDPGKTFKLPLRNVCSFYDNVMSAKIKEDVKKAGCVKEHEGLTFHALRYINRRAKGYQDDPSKFFDQTYPFFLVEKCLKGDPNPDIKIPPLYITHENGKSIRKCFKAVEGTSHDSEAEVSTDSDEETIQVEDQDYLTKLTEHVAHVNNKSTDKLMNRIVQFILSGKADDYLQKIWSKTVASEYFDKYEKNIKCSKTKLSSETYSGIFEDSQKLRDLISYLLSLYDSAVDNKPVMKNMKTKETTFQRDQAQYVASVWLPESIIYAISKIQRVTMSKAKCLFKSVPESKTKALENVLNSLDTVFKETAIASSSKTNKNKEEKQEAVKHSSEIGICSPLKKLRVSLRDCRFVPLMKSYCKADDGSKAEGSDKIVEKSDVKYAAVSPRKVYPKRGKRLDFQRPDNISEVERCKSDEIVEESMESYCKSDDGSKAEGSDKIVEKSDVKCATVSPRKVYPKRGKRLDFQRLDNISEVEKRKSYEIVEEYMESYCESDDGSKSEGSHKIVEKSDVKCAAVSPRKVYPKRGKRLDFQRLDNIPEVQRCKSDEIVEECHPKCDTLANQKTFIKGSKRGKNCKK